MARLLAIVGIAFLASIGASHANVLCVQEFMLQTAFDPGPADGAWGKKTSTALEDFFAQIGETPDGGVGRNNAEELCALFSGPRHNELLELGAYRVYSVSVNPDAISVSPGRTEFDFTRFEIADASFERCDFAMGRKRRAEGAVEPDKLVTGALTIKNGTLVFGKHQWRTGGLADESYLSDEANLKLTTSGQIVGKTPYFHMFIDDQTQAQPPQYPTLSTSFTPTGDFPSGITEFPAEGMEDGMFYLECKSDGGPTLINTAFDFSGYDVADDVDVRKCLFSINVIDPQTDKVDDYPWANGDLTIVDGRLVFGDHQWNNNGMANATYLPREANLMITRSGQIVGKAPYFHMMFEPGETGQPPNYVTLSDSYIPGPNFPSGDSRFSGGGAEDATFRLICFPS